MKIHKQGGQVIYEGVFKIDSFDGNFPIYGMSGVSQQTKIIELTENLSASDKRRKLLTVELSQDEIKECVDKLGYKLMPQWLVTVCEVVGKVKVKLKGLVK